MSCSKDVIGRFLLTGRILRWPSSGPQVPLPLACHGASGGFAAFGRSTTTRRDDDNDVENATSHDVRNGQNRRGLASTGWNINGSPRWRDAGHPADVDRRADRKFTSSP